MLATQEWTTDIFTVGVNELMLVDKTDIILEYLKNSGITEIS